MKTKNNKMIATAVAIILLVIAIIISLVFVFNNRHRPRLIIISLMKHKDMYLSRIIRKLKQLT